MRAFLLGALVLGISWGVAPADPIIPKSGSLFADHAGRQVGDVLTILIVEQTRASKATLTKTRTSASHGASSVDKLDFIGMWGLDARNESLGEGSTARRGDLQARLTARITEIDPNGLLHVSGTRTVLVNGEEERITLTGLVRPQDVQSDNTVLSTFLADAAIEFTGEGVLASAERPGMLTRLFNWLF